MRTYTPKPAPKSGATGLALRFYPFLNQEVQQALDRLRQRYGAYAVSAEEVRQMMDKALGTRALTEELYRSRED